MLLALSSCILRAIQPGNRLAYYKPCASCPAQLRQKALELHEPVGRAGRRRSLQAINSSASHGGISAVVQAAPAGRDAAEFLPQVQLRCSACCG